MINNTKTECETGPCQYDALPRTRFYNGMLLTAEHLRAEQTYHREMLKRFNRHVFGAGIICGLTVESQDMCIKVQPGIALDCCGNLIEVCKCISFDLSKLCKEKFGQGCIQDPTDTTSRVITKNLVLSYAEKESDPEPVLTPAADCRSAGEESKCQNSKVQEGYCIELWDADKCPCMETKRGQVKPGGDPKSGGNVPTDPNPVEAPKAGTEQMRIGAANQPKTFEDVLEAFLDDNPLPCYPCGCCENSVGLGTLTIDCAANTVTVENTCRTYVISPRLVRWIIDSIQTKERAQRLLRDMTTLGGETGPGPEIDQSKDTTTATDTTDKTTRKSAAGGRKAADKNPAEAEAQPAATEEPKK